MTLYLTVNGIWKRLSSLPILMQNHSGGDSVAIGIVPLFVPLPGSLVPLQAGTARY